MYVPDLALDGRKIEEGGDLARGAKNVGGSVQRNLVVSCFM